jgi:hypothetical protein
MLSRGIHHNFRWGFLAQAAHAPCLTSLLRKTTPAISRYQSRQYGTQAAAEAPLPDRKDEQPESITESLIAQSQSIGSQSTTKSTYTTQSSPYHTNLRTFLRYAKLTGLSEHSNIYVGTRYEYTCQETLSHFGFDLQRTGGAFDAGIDLLGSWRVPTRPATNPLRALVQCKFRRAKPGPSLVRELEGAFVGAPLAWKGGDLEQAVGVLCVPGEPTKAVREAVKRCGRPVMLARVREDGGAPVVCFWNRAVEALVSGVEVGVRYRDGEKEAVLIFQGEVWEDLKAQEESRDDD